EHFYHMMVVDAFSSDAIPAHLITTEAIGMYFEKLAPHGILCVHTSNKHVDLVPVVANAARHAQVDAIDPVTGKFKIDPTTGEKVKQTGLVCRSAHDVAPFDYQVNLVTTSGNNAGHYTSEWVMVARTWEDLKGVEVKDGKADAKDGVWRGLQPPE